MTATETQTETLDAAAVAWLMADRGSQIDEYAILRELLRRPAWHAEAACRGVDQEPFFPVRGHNVSVAPARAICADCPVRRECAQYAIDHADVVGFWANATTRDRRKARRLGWDADQLLEHVR